jgi:chromosome segregation ATPase
MADHSTFLDHLPGWLAGLFGAVVAGWTALRAKRSSLATVEQAESNAEMARLSVFGQSFATLRDLLDYFEKRFDAVSAEAERLRSEAEHLREDNRGLRERAIAHEREVDALRSEVQALREEVARLKTA